MRIVQERGLRLPERYLEFAPAGARRSSAPWRSATTAPVPCNNDLLAENFIWTGDRFRLIDYEYSGNNDPMFELGNVWSESNLSLAQLDELVAHYYGRPLVNKVARRASGASSRSTAGRSGPRSRTASRRSTSTSGAGAWRSTSAPSRSSTARTSQRLCEDVRRDD